MEGEEGEAELGTGRGRGGEREGEAKGPLAHCWRRRQPLPLTPYPMGGGTIDSDISDDEDDFEQRRAAPSRRGRQSRSIPPASCLHSTLTARVVGHGLQHPHHPVASAQADEIAAEPAEHPSAKRPRQETLVGVAAVESTKSGAANPVAVPALTERRQLGGPTPEQAGPDGKNAFDLLMRPIRAEVADMQSALADSSEVEKQTSTKECSAAAAAASEENGAEEVASFPIAIAAPIGERLSSAPAATDPNGNLQHAAAEAFSSQVKASGSFRRSSRGAAARAREHLRTQKYAEDASAISSSAQCDAAKLGADHDGNKQSYQAEDLSGETVLTKLSRRKCSSRSLTSGVQKAQTDAQPLVDSGGTAMAVSTAQSTDAEVKQDVEEEEPKASRAAGEFFLSAAEKRERRVLEAAAKAEAAERQALAAAAVAAESARARSEAELARRAKEAEELTQRRAAQRDRWLAEQKRAKDDLAKVNAGRQVASIFHDASERAAVQAAVAVEARATSMHGALDVDDIEVELADSRRWPMPLPPSYEDWPWDAALATKQPERTNVANEASAQVPNRRRHVDDAKDSSVRRVACSTLDASLMSLPALLEPDLRGAASILFPVRKAIATSEATGCVRNLKEGSSAEAMAGSEESGSASRSSHIPAKEAFAPSDAPANKTNQSVIDALRNDALPKARKPTTDEAVGWRGLLNRRSPSRLANEWSQSLWCELLRPCAASEVCSADRCALQLRSWLQKKLAPAARPQAKSKPQHQRRRRKPRSNFIVSSDESDEQGSIGSDQDGELAEPNLLLLEGPTGSGKTAAVYAVASELGMRVIEVNPSMVRAGRQVLAKFAEATQSKELSTWSAPQDASGEKPNPRSKIANGVGEARSKGVIGAFFGHKVDAKATVEKGGGLVQSRVGKDRKPDIKATSAAENVHATKYPSASAAGQPHSGECSARGAAGTRSEEMVTLMLFEEVDIVFEDDIGFYSALRRLARESKCPMVATCNVAPRELVCGADPLPSLYWDRPPEKSLVDYASAICGIIGLPHQSEPCGSDSITDNTEETVLGRALDPGRMELAQLVAHYRGDVRRVLLALQCWCDGTLLQSALHVAAGLADFKRAESSEHSIVPANVEKHPREPLRYEVTIGLSAACGGLALSDALVHATVARAALMATRNLSGGSRVDVLQGTCTNESQSQAHSVISSLLQLQLSALAFLREVMGRQPFLEQPLRLLDACVGGLILGDGVPEGETPPVELLQTGMVSPAGCSLDGPLMMWQTAEEASELGAEEAEAVTHEPAVRNRRLRLKRKCIEDADEGTPKNVLAQFDVPRADSTADFTTLQTPAPVAVDVAGEAPRTTENLKGPALTFNVMQAPMTGAEGSGEATATRMPTGGAALNDAMQAAGEEAAPEAMEVESSRDTPRSPQLAGLHGSQSAIVDVVVDGSVDPLAAASGNAAKTAASDDTAHCWVEPELLTGTQSPWVSKGDCVGGSSACKLPLTGLCNEITPHDLADSFLEVVAEMHETLSWVHTFSLALAPDPRPNSHRRSSPAPQSTASDITWWGGPPSPFTAERILAEASDAAQLLAASRACARIAAFQIDNGSSPPRPPASFHASLLSLPCDEVHANARAQSYRHAIAPVMPRLVEVAQACGAGSAHMRHSHADYLGAARDVIRIDAIRRLSQRKRRHTSYLARCGLSDDQITALKGGD